VGEEGLREGSGRAFFDSGKSRRGCKRRQGEGGTHKDGTPKKKGWPVIGKDDRSYHGPGSEGGGTREPQGVGRGNEMDNQQINVTQSWESPGWENRVRGREKRRSSKSLGLIGGGTENQKREWEVRKAGRGIKTHGSKHLSTWAWHAHQKKRLWGGGGRRKTLGEKNGGRKTRTEFKKIKTGWRGHERRGQRWA